MQKMSISWCCTRKLSRVLTSIPFEPTIPVRHVKPDTHTVKVMYAKGKDDVGHRAQSGASEERERERERERQRQRERERDRERERERPLLFFLWLSGHVWVASAQPRRVRLPCHRCLQHLRQQREKHG